MPLPERVRVKLSSEQAGYIAMTPVVVQEFTLLELLEHVLSATGKDGPRAADILRRGSLVSGASRLRWQPLPAEPEELARLFELLPGPDPARAFAATNCVRAVLAGPATRLEIMKEAAQPKRLLERRSFWDALLAEAVCPAYSTYHYRDRADVYRQRLEPLAAERLRAAAGLLRFDTLAQQIQGARFDSLELYTRR